jgi:cytochrome c553
MRIPFVLRLLPQSPLSNIAANVHRFGQLATMQACLKKPLLVVGLSLLATQVQAEQPSAAVLAQVTVCQSCHQANGAGNAELAAPALAGQDADYLARQLVNFQQGWRGKDPRDQYGQQMLSIAASVQDVAAVAAYFKQLPVPKPSGEVSGDLQKGRTIYVGNCGSCHGGNAQGNPAFAAPSLLGQHSSYLLRQLEHFKNGVRGVEKADKPGRQMAMMAKTLNSTEEMNQVIAYIQSLQ